MLSFYTSKPGEFGRRIQSRHLTSSDVISDPECITQLYHKEAIVSPVYRFCTVCYYKSQSTETEYYKPLIMKL